MAKARALRGPIKAFGLVGPIKAHELFGTDLVEVVVGGFTDSSVIENQTTSGYFDCAGAPIAVPLLSRIAMVTPNIGVSVTDPADATGLIFENDRSGVKLTIGGCSIPTTWVGETAGASGDVSGYRWDAFAPPGDQMIAAHFTWFASTIPVDWVSGDTGTIYQLQ